jgi:putative solute:sodium symporter small subunit
VLNSAAKHGGATALTVQKTNNTADPMAFKSEQDKQAYWRENISLVLKLLAVWFLVSFGCGILFVDALNSIRFFGFKLGFWFAQQGAIYVFVILIFIYVHLMNRLDKKYGVDEE